MQPDTGGCLAGDIIITSDGRGFAVGRALSEPGPDRWWECLAVARGLREAITHARRYAENTPDVRIWLHEGGSVFLPVTPELGHATD